MNLDATGGLEVITEKHSWKLRELDLIASPPAGWPWTSQFIFLADTGWAISSPLALAFFFQSKAMGGHGLILVAGTWRLTLDGTYWQWTLSSLHVSQPPLESQLGPPPQGFELLLFSLNAGMASPPGFSNPGGTAAKRLQLLATAPLAPASSLGSLQIPGKRMKVVFSIVNETQVRTQSSVSSPAIFPLLPVTPGKDK